MMKEGVWWKKCRKGEEVLFDRKKPKEGSQKKETKTWFWALISKKQGEGGRKKRTIWTMPLFSGR